MAEQMFFSGHYEQWTVGTAEKWSSYAIRLYLSSITKSETKLAVYLGSPATEKLLPEWNPIHQEKQKSKDKKPEEKLLHFTAGKLITHVYE